ncbi:MAG: DUF7507 domain-containing protein [Clostridium sp.]
MATSFLLRKSLTIPGGITLTGNTLGLGDKNWPYQITRPNGLFGTIRYGYGAHDIGAFITTDTSQTVQGYPAGTTRNWSLNSSEAILRLPAGAKVVYAELLWGGQTRSNGFDGYSPENLDGVINTPVRFTTPSGAVFNISPDPATYGQSTITLKQGTQNGYVWPYTGGDDVYYIRSQNVTNIVAQFGAGKYGCGGVPAAINMFAPGGQRCCGWDLVVMYELATNPIKNLTLFVGIDAIGSAFVSQITYTTGGITQQVNPTDFGGPREINISGFITPSSGPVTSRILMSAMAGDPYFTWSAVPNQIFGIGDNMSFGPNLASAQLLSGPNNLINNFWASQINNDAGFLDTSGTDGGLNTNPSAGVLGEVKRQGWDITNLQSNNLTNGQNAASVVINKNNPTTNGDELAVHLIALEIPVNAPKLDSVKSVDKQLANTGETITYTVVTTNNGTTDATNVTFIDTIPSGTTFVPGTVIVNGTPNATAIPNPPGFSVPNLPPGATNTVTFQVKVGTTIPSPNPIPNAAFFGFQYTQGPGQPVFSGGSGTNTVNTLIDVAPKPELTSIKQVNTASTVIGDKVVYTVTLINTGNVQLNNAVFLDTMPNGTSFVPDSLSINNNNSPLNPQTGVPVGTLAVGESVTLQWLASVDTLPSPNPFINQGATAYTYATGTNPVTPGVTTTNTVATAVQQALPNVQIVKQVNKTQAAVGETVIYTVTFTNKGNITLNNLIFQDTLSNGLQFVAQSVVVSGVNQTTANPEVGFIAIDTLPVGQSVTIQFSALIVTLPTPNPIPNIADVSYNFRPFPGATPVTGAVTSNEVNTSVFEGQNPVLNLEKQVSITEGSIGDTITYTIGITNEGNVDLFNVKVTDAIPNGTSFIPGSMQLNFTPVSGSPVTGVTIPILPVNGVAFLTFQVKVNQLPIPNPIPNKANADYESLDINGNTIPSTTISNTVTTLIKPPVPSSTILKEVDKSIAAVGETVTYTVRMVNTGAIPLNNIFLVDTLPNGLQFVPQSVTIDGINDPAASVPPGFSIGNLSQGQGRVVQFQAVITTIPNPNPMQNNINAIYQYTTNQTNPNGNTGSIVSNTVPTQVIIASLNVSKLVDKPIANIGETLTYTLIVNNPNIIPLTNIVVIDTIPVGTTFIPNSAVVNGNPTSANPQNGINIGTLNPNANGTITFQVTVVSVPANGQILNTHFTTANYRPSPTSPLSSVTATSNQVVTTVPQQGIGSTTIVKAVDKTSATVGDVITYTSTITNNGTLPLTNVIFTDGLEASNISFNAGSVTVNGASQPSANPQSGVTIGNLAVGQSATVTFTVTINGVPVPNPIPNTSSDSYNYTPVGGTQQSGTNTSNQVNTSVTTPQGTGSTSIVKQVDKTSATVGDVITYTSTITNTGSLPLTNVVFTDGLEASNVSFNAGSVTVNGASQPSANPATGVPIGSLAVGQTATVVFKVTINGVPVPNPIPNTSSDSYNYTPVGGTQQSGTNTSNQVNTTVTTPQGTGSTSIVKQVDKTQATVGDVLTYTSTITNTGSLPLTNVIFTDPITASNVSFNSGSVTVNGASQPAANPQTGVNVGSLAVGASATVVFNVTVNGVPVPNPIPNTSSDTYNYTPVGGTQQTGTNNSNTVNTTVTTPSGTGSTSVVKSVDKTTAQIGDTLTYTSVITNTGSLPLTNVVFTDGLEASNVSFVPGSLTINGAPSAGSPLTGVALPNLPVGGTATVVFRVTVNGTPVPNPIPNTSTDSYTYTPNGGTPTNGTNTSNQVNTLVSIPGGIGSTSVVKSVDKTTAQVGDTLTYTSVITNTGNLPLTNLIFTDTLQSTNTSFVSGSVTVNGTSNAGNPAFGIPIGALPVGGSVIVVYRVLVNGIPVPNPIPNTSADSYTYTPNGGSPTNGGNTSNQVNTQVTGQSQTGSSTVTKTVDKANANVGDTLNYTITVTNTGSLPLDNVVVTDPIPSSNVSFVPGSVTVNGVSNSGDPQTGINVGNIPVGGNVVIVYRVTVNGVPVPNPIQNVAVDKYTYTPPGGSPTPGTDTSNPAVTTVNNPSPGGTAASSIIKSVDKTKANIGDVLTYTSTITNTGNLPLSNVVFTDPIVSSSVSFVPGSVTVNGVSNAGNPANGINVGNIPVGGTVTVVFRVTVNGIPVPNPIPNTSGNTYTYTPNGGSPTNGGNYSNTVNTLVSIPGGTGSSTIIKSVDKTTAQVGDTLTYTSVITNTGNVPLSNLVFTDQNQSSNVTFVPGSVTVNGVSNAGNPASGVAVGSLAVGASATVVYRVTINAIPSPNPIPNISTDSYTFTPSGGTPQVGGNISNQVNTSVTTPGPTQQGSSSIVKTVDKQTANVGDTLTYTATVTNTGQLDLNNVIFKDAITSSNVSFVPGSVTVNGASNSGNPQTGINIGNIPVGGNIIVTFKVKVDALPVPNPIQNFATDEYTYTPPGGSPTPGTNTSNPAITTVTNPGTGGTGALSAIKQADKQTANIGDTITYTATVTNTGTLTATNVVYTDPLPASNVSYVPGSVTVNGVANAGNPASGISIGTLPPGGTATVVFKLTVNGTPVPNPIKNIGNVTFTYTPNGGTPQPGTTPTNPTNTLVPGSGNSGTATSNITKSVDKTSAQVGDTLTYTSVITNTGNLPLTNVIFNDTVEATNVSFIPGSVTVNGASNSGNPATGINVGNIPVGGSVTVVYRVTINGIPVPNPIPNTSSNTYTYTPNGGSPTNGGNTSNQVNTSVQNQSGQGQTTILKNVDKTTASVGDTLTYTSFVTNTGSLPLTNVVFTDPIIATNVSFVPGSVTVNGVPNGGNPQSGVTIGNLAVGAISIITFKVTINGNPTPNPIPNTSSTSYTYTPVGGSPTNGSNNSNTVNTNVNQVSGQPITQVTKQVSKTVAGAGETLTYTLTATNTGAVAANNVVITDNPPVDTTFVPNSVSVNGVSQPGANPSSGVNVGTLNPGQTVVLTYNVTLPSDRLPNPNPVPNTGNLNYNYIPSQGGTPVPVNLTSNQVTTQVNAAIIPPGTNTANPGITKSVDKTVAQIGDVLTYTVNVTNKGNITTQSTTIRDLVPSGTVFVPGSVTVNGASRPADNPGSGIDIGPLAPGATTVVQFRVTIISATSNNLISNVANVDYTYIPDPNNPVPSTGTSPSNQVDTTLGNPPINPQTGVVKKSDKGYVQVGDVITYTVDVTNSGTTSALNAIFVDTPPSGTTFVANSVTVNGVSRPGANPATGFSLGTIAPGQTLVVSYQLKVTSMPNPNPLVNKATVNYSYQPDPTKPPVTTTVTSPPVTVQVNEAVISPTDGGLSKSVDKGYAQVGDVLTYTVTMRNTGNTIANNVVLTDAIPSGTSFVNGSVTINGVASATSNPAIGIPVGSINPNSSTVVTFKVTVITIPNPNPIPNKGNVTYNFTVDPNNPNGGSGNNNTNIVTTTVSQGFINPNTGIVKSSNKPYASVGDVVTYTVNITNSGNTAVNNVIFRDTIAQGTTFITNSFTVNGGIIPGANPNQGVNIGSINPGQTAVVKFNVTIDTVPNPNPIINIANVNYQYVVNPNTGETGTGGGGSNPTPVTVVNANIDPNNGVVKSVDKAYSTIGDTLTYTIRVTNSGNAPAENVVFYDTIPKGTTFIPNSVIVDGATRLNQTPGSGVSLGTIAPNQTVIVSFKVNVVSAPSGNLISNAGSVQYSYVVNPSTGQTVTTTSPSNVVTTQLNNVIIDPNNNGFVKTADKEYVKIGDVVTYTVLVNNTGNTPAINVVVQDTVPVGATFVDNSVTINGTPVTGVNPNVGIPVGTINPNTQTTIKFKVVVTSVPNPNKLVNTATINYNFTVDPNNPGGGSGGGVTKPVVVTVNTANISNNDGGLVKSVDKAYASVGDLITYTISLKNTGNVAAQNVVLLDTLAQGTQLVQGSVQVNGQTITGVDPNLGLQLGTIQPNGSVIIVYKVKVIDIPNPNPIPNKAQVNYSFISDPTNPVPQNVTNTSNQVVTAVNSPNITPNNNSAIKTVDKAYAKVGDTITYTITVTNKGNVAATNVVVTDSVPSGTKYVDNSVTVNGTTQVGANPTIGVAIPDILPGNTTVITYQAIVTQVPAQNPILNTANVNYTFTQDPNKPNGATGNVTTNQTQTQVNSANISPNNGGLVKSVDKQYADVGDVITYTITAKNTGNVSANNVILTDKIPNGTTYVQGSLRVNGIEQSDNPEKGIQVGTIAPGSTAIISFKVQVTTLVNPNVVNNDATISYNFTTNPQNPNGESATNTSNNVQTVINSAVISPTNGSLIKSVDKEYASIGDVLTYTVTLMNTGNVAAENVVMIDTIPGGTSFVNGSVTVNGVSQASSNPQNGVPIGLIPVNGKVTVQFKVNVTTIPMVNPIPNSALVNYKYLVNPSSGAYKQNSSLSNIVYTKVNTADLTPGSGGSIKSVDKPYADLGEVVTYTITLTNKGNVPAINVLVKDTIPVNTTFIENSVTINGVVQIGANPQNGISLAQVAPGETKVISFKARVDSIPNPNIITNIANVSYSYIVDPVNQTQIDNNINTNPANTTINSGQINPNNGGFQKTADKQYASLGDTINYTIRVVNTGNVPVNNVIVQDTVPNGTSFVNNSILVNGVRRAGDNLTSGINLGTLAPGQQDIITFSVVVTSIPKVNPIPNSAVVNYTYTVDPNKPNGASGNGNTNTVLTQINYADISPQTGGIVKSVDKPYADIGSEVTYTVTLKNSGNVDANNIVLYDTIPQGTTFVPNSVFVNSSNVVGANPQTGINVGILEPNRITVVTFKVKVTSIPNGNKIPNQAIVDFTYTKDPNFPNGVFVENGSNIVQTTVSTGIVTPGTIPTGPDGKPIVGPDGKPLPPTGGFTKTSDKSYAQVGETISYTMLIQNTGNVAITNVKVIDTLPNALQFVSGSLAVDGVTNSTADISKGFVIPSIGANQYKTITFKAKVVSIPDSNPIKNQGYLSYQYIVDPSKPPVNGSSSSNENNVTVNSAIISPTDGGFVKSVDRTYAELGDTLTYTIVVKNTGNVKANNVIVRDTVPTGTTFVPGSVIVNGNPDQTLNPQTGIGILVLNPGATAVITYQVKVVSLNYDFKVRNTANVSYDFVLDPNKPQVNQTSTSNTVITNQNSVDFSGTNFTKSVDNQYASLGDNVEYTFTIRNGGNIMATNVVFRDTIPDVMQFVAGSVYANGINLPNANPQIGVSLGTVGVNETITLSFKTKVISIPANKDVVNVGKLTFASQVNPNENPVVTTVPSNKEDVYIVDPAIKFTKVANTNTAVVGDTVIYTLTIADTGNVDVQNVRVVDDLSPSLEFIPGSVTIGGKPSPNDNIVSGLVIDTIKAGKAVTVTFKAKVIDYPETSTIVNIANINYSYITNPNEGPRGNTLDSNPVVLNTENAQINVTKTANTAFAKMDDIITYTVVFENVGTLEGKNLIFFDTISKGVSFIPGSFSINGKKVNSVDISRGVTIGSLKPGEKAVVKYSVIVTGVNPCRKITNAAYGVFEYQVTPKSSLVQKTTDTASLTIISQSPNFKQMNIDGVIYLCNNMPPIEEVNEISAVIDITNHYVIDTIRGVSAANSKLTGQKLVLNGFIHETIEYTSCMSTQSVHYTCQTKKFSTFIVIEEGNLIGADIQTEALIEDISFTQLSESSVYTNITFNIDALINR